MSGFSWPRGAKKSTKALSTACLLVVALMLGSTMLAVDSVQAWGGWAAADNPWANHTTTTNYTAISSSSKPCDAVHDVVSVIHDVVVQDAVQDAVDDAVKDLLVTDALAEQTHLAVRADELHDNGPQRVLARRLLSAWPVFAPRVAGVSETCRNHSERYVRELRDLTLWAFQMHDASAKLPSGILNGNVNQLGDFDQCLSAASPDGEVRGQYCLAYLQLQLRRDNDAKEPHPVLAAIYDGVYSHHAFRSSFEDPGHRVPRFSTINWAVCVPSACSAGDVALQVEQWARAATAGTGLGLRVRVDRDMCQVRVPLSSMPLSSVLATAFFLGVLLLMGVASVYDYMQREKPSEPGLGRDLLLAFSLPKNLDSLLSLRRSSDDIESVHGVRFVNAIMLVVCHKSMSVFYNAYSNRTQMSEGIGQQWTTIARAASLYTDPFIMLSGLLTSYAYFKKLERGQGINIVEELRNRLIRLVPSLAAIIMFCTLVLPWLGSGPQWNLVIKTHSDICKKHWWRNLLFIHNFFGFENMCLTHTHHVGIDTQLFVISPLFVWLLWYRPKQGLTILGVIATISTILRFYATYFHQLSFFVYFGSSISQMFRTADLSYMMPTHRLTVYLMGIVLGYILRHCGRDFKLKQSHLTLGWTAALICGYLSVVTPSFMGKVGYVYDALHAANYAAFLPITWCLMFGWIIFTSYIGKGGAVGRALSWRGFLVCTRLSYALYLTQFPVFFYNVGLTNAPAQYSVFVMFNVKETAAIFLVSALLTLMFEMPAQNVKNAISRFRKQRKLATIDKALHEEPQKIKAQ